MATACRFLSEDQFQCCICLDVFTEPVSTPCGHNFCKACLTRHWEGKEQRECPVCKEKFNTGLKLSVNTGFRDVVENFREHHAIVDNNPPLKPGQVPCDCCLDNKLQASKTCLVCLTSYCETHLEPHRRVAALKRHKLTNPVHNLEDQICKKHNRMLELFCRNDNTCVCVLCTEHSAHDTVPLEEAIVDKRAQVLKKKEAVREFKHRRGKRAQKKGKDKAMTNSMVLNQMQALHIWWIPHLCNIYGFVLRIRDLAQGRLYREVRSEESSRQDLEVAREPMRGIRTFIPNPTNGNWVIRLGTDANCNALHCVPVQFFLIKKPDRVLVIVDYDNGLVSFFDADTMTLAHSFIGFQFTERIYLFYCPILTDDGSWLQRLQKKFQEIKEWSQITDTILIFYCIVFVFVLVICVMQDKG